MALGSLKGLRPEALATASAVAIWDNASLNDLALIDTNLITSMGRNGPMLEETTRILAEQKAAAKEQAKIEKKQRELKQQALLKRVAEDKARSKQAAAAKRDDPRVKRAIELAAEKAAKNEVLKRLKAPATARFLSSTPLEFDRRFHLYMFRVSAQNVFGATLTEYWLSAVRNVDPERGTYDPPLRGAESVGSQRPTAPMVQIYCGGTGW